MCVCMCVCALQAGVPQAVQRIWSSSIRLASKVEFCTILNSVVRMDRASDMPHIGDSSYLIHFLSFLQLCLNYLIYDVQSFYKRRTTPKNGCFTFVMWSCSCTRTSDQSAMCSGAHINREPSAPTVGVVAWVVPASPT